MTRPRPTFPACPNRSARSNRSALLGISLFASLLTTLLGCGGSCPEVRSPSNLDDSANADPALELSVNDDSNFLERYARTLGFRLGQPANIRFTPDGREVLFLRSEARSFARALYAFDIESGEERVLLTSEMVLQGAEEELSAEERARRERLRLAATGITTYELSRDGASILVPLSGRLFIVTRETGQVRELPDEGGYANDADLSPDGTKVACVRDGDLYVIDIARNRQRRLTQTASETIQNGLPEFVAQEEMGRYHGYWWSPDSAKILYQETNTEGVERLHASDPTHPEVAPHGSPYPRAGRQNATVRLGIISASGGRTRFVDWDNTAFPYLATVRWSQQAPLTILVQDRRQRVQQLLRVNPDSGSTETLLEETDSAWLNLDQTMPRYVRDGQAFLWSTERDGTFTVELRRGNGELIRQVVGPEHGYSRLVHIDHERELLWYEGGSEPTESHVFVASISEEGPASVRALTATPGMHRAVVSKDGNLWIHEHEALSYRPRRDVRTFDGLATGPAVDMASEVTSLTDASEAPGFTPSVELVTVSSSDGTRDYRAQLVRPQDFDASQRYPVLLSVYAGPHVNLVRQEQDRNYLRQFIADQGFILVTLDGRGTPRRGRAWERAIVDNFIDIPLHDQVEGLQAVLARFPELDGERVGVFGWSFGGYFSAMATMRRPDIFRAGIAGAPVADWRDYDTHYTERYIGLPGDNAAAYDVSSALTYASELRRPLLIMHGTSDDNVYFTHALRMSDALFRAGRDHDFVVLPGATHMVADPEMTRAQYGRVIRFFKRHL